MEFEEFVDLHENWLDDRFSLSSSGTDKHARFVQEININLSLILKVREIIFFSRAKYILRHL